MVVALRAVRVLLSGGVLTEPQGRAGKNSSFWEPFLLCQPCSRAPQGRQARPCKVAYSDGSIITLAPVLRGP